MLHLKQDRFTICFQTSILGGGGEFTILWCQGYLTDRQTNRQIDQQTDGLDWQHPWVTIIIHCSLKYLYRTVSLKNAQIPSFIKKRPSLSILCIYRQRPSFVLLTRNTFQLLNANITDLQAKVEPTVTRPKMDPLAVLCLEN